MTRVESSSGNPLHLLQSSTFTKRRAAEQVRYHVAGGDYRDEGNKAMKMAEGPQKRHDRLASDVHNKGGHRAVMKQAPMPGYGMVWEPDMKTGLWNCTKDDSQYHIKAWELTQKPKQHVIAGDFRGHLSTES